MVGACGLAGVGPALLGTIGLEALLPACLSSCHSAPHMQHDGPRSGRLQRLLMTAHSQDTQYHVLPADRTVGCGLPPATRQLNRGCRALSPSHPGHSSGSAGLMTHRNLGPSLLGKRATPLPLYSACKCLLREIPSPNLLPQLFPLPTLCSSAPLQSSVPAAFRLLPPCR